MRITNRDLVSSVQAIQALRGLKPSIKGAHAIALAFHKLEAFYNAYNDSMKDLRACYPALDDPTVTVEARQAAEKEVEPDVLKLLALEIEIEQAPLAIGLLVDAKGQELEVEVGSLQSLWWLFTA